MNPRPVAYALAILSTWGKDYDPLAPTIQPGRNRRQKHGGTRLTWTSQGRLRKRTRNKARRQAIRRSRAS